tara:strand:- start:2542 stop:2964 length:423 start_codon:yes stop_codon:yes gene_type:complete
MGRLLGLDYGSKRVGVAETDDLQIIASPLITIHSQDIVNFILDYSKKFDLDAVIVGTPKNLDLSDTHATKMVDQFTKHLRKKINPIEVILQDERFTSKIALQSMITGGVKKSKRREKGVLDKVSASIILQSYLEKRAKGF